MSQSIDTEAMNHLLQLDTVSSGRVGGRRWVESGEGPTNSTPSQYVVLGL